MTEEQMRSWIKRLIEISKTIEHLPNMDRELETQKICQLLGYIESLENIEL